MKNKFNQFAHKLMLGLLALHLVLPAGVTLAAGQIQGSYNESALGMADGQGTDNYDYTTHGVHDFVFRVDTELADGDYFEVEFPSVMPVVEPQAAVLATGASSVAIDQAATLSGAVADAGNNLYRIDIATVSGVGNPWVEIAGLTTNESNIPAGNFMIYLRHYDATDVLKNSGTAVASSDANNNVQISARILPTAPVNTSMTTPGTNPVGLRWDKSLTTPLGIDGYLVRWMKKADEDAAIPCPESPIDPADETNAPALPWYQGSAVYNSLPYADTFHSTFTVNAIDGVGLYCVEVRAFSKGTSPMISNPDKLIVNVITLENSLCGDGIIQNGEQCDDGNQVDGDGCNAVCEKENTSSGGGDHGGGDDDGGDDGDDDQGDDNDDQGDDDQGDDDQGDEGDDQGDEGDEDQGDEDQGDEGDDQGDEGDDQGDEGDEDQGDEDQGDDDGGSDDHSDDVDNIIGGGEHGDDNGNGHQNRNRDRNGNGIPDWWEEEYFGKWANIEPDEDPDQDGLTNRQEYYANTDPTNPDSDDDGLMDGYETKQSKTNPLEADSDGDGLSDGAELQKNTDPKDPDSDDDGYNDGVEIQMNTNPLDPNSYPTDIDGDDVADSWEIQYFDSVNYDEYGKRDYDNDGLADIMEYELGTNPLLQDTDGDGYSDGEEVLDYGTDPLNPSSNPDIFKVMITNWKDGEAAAYNYPVFRGIAPANATVEVYISQDGESRLIASTEADDARKFVTITDSELEDGEYVVMAVAYDQKGEIIGKTNAIKIKIDSTLGVDSPDRPRIEELEGNFIQEDENLLDIEDLSLTICNQRPVLRGRTSYGSQVHAIWHSLIMSSSVIADSQTGEFIVSPKDMLELGEHEVIVYAEKEGLKSDLIHIPFTVTTECEEVYHASALDSHAWFSWLWVMLGSGLAVFGYYAFAAHHAHVLAAAKKFAKKADGPMRTRFHHRGEKRKLRRKRKIEESEEFIV